MESAFSETEKYLIRSMTFFACSRLRNLDFPVHPKAYLFGSRLGFCNRNALADIFPSSLSIEMGLVTYSGVNLP